MCRFLLVNDFIHVFSDKNIKHFILRDERIKYFE